MLKTRRPLGQLLMVLGITLVCFVFLGGLLGPFLISAITGVNLNVIAHPETWDFSQPVYANIMRGLQMIQFVTLFLIPVLISAYFFSGNTKEYIGVRKPWSPEFYVAGILLLIISYPLVEWLGVLNQQIPLPASWLKWIGEKEDGMAQILKGMLSRHELRDLLLNIVFIAGLAAVGEELFFRSLLQRLFIKLFRNHWTGIIVAALLFSAIHMQFFGFIPRFVLGVILGMIYWYSNSIYVVMAAHFVYDASLILLAYFKPGLMTEGGDAQIPYMLVMGVVSLVLTVALCWWLIRRSKTTYNGVYGDDAVPVPDEYPF